MSELRPPPPKPPAPRPQPPACPGGASPSGQRKITFPISQSLRLDLADRLAENFGIESRLVRKKREKPE